MNSYHGRFAPSPSGLLHFGSLVAAVGSYLRARSLNGFWHLRIEDIDITRCKPEYSSGIIKDLEHLGMQFDGPVIYQSKRLSFYQEKLDELISRGLTYNCSCTRADIKSMGGIYTGRCRNLNLSASPERSIRYRNDYYVESFTDYLHGRITNPEKKPQDIILKRRDGIFAYNLVCLLDDIDTGITEVVRGSDLLYDTFSQISLLQGLKAPVPQYLHLPLALSENRQKYSKQNHATHIDVSRPGIILVKAIEFLGQKMPDEIEHEKPEIILNYAVKNFNPDLIPAENRRIEA